MPAVSPCCQSLFNAATERFRLRSVGSWDSLLRDSVVCKGLDCAESLRHGQVECGDASRQNLGASVENAVLGRDPQAYGCSFRDILASHGDADRAGLRKDDIRTKKVSVWRGRHVLSGDFRDGKRPGEIDIGTGDRNAVDAPRCGRASQRTKVSLEPNASVIVAVIATPRFQRTISGNPIRPQQDGAARTAAPVTRATVFGSPAVGGDF